MRGKTDKALSVLDRLMGKEKAAPELVEIKESFRKQEPSMRPYFLFMGMWLVLFLLLYGALELAGNTSALEIALIGSFFVSLIFPVRSFGILIIFVGVLLSGFQQLSGSMSCCIMRRRYLRQWGPPPMPLCCSRSW